MPATINGAPTHVLIVHIVAVMLPLSVLGSLVLVAIPATRRAFGLLTVGVGLVGCVAVPLAFASGSALRDRVSPSSLIDRHINLAHQLLPVAAIFGLSLAAFVVIDVVRRFRHDQLNQVEAAILQRLPSVRDYSRRHRLYAVHRGAAGILVVTALATMVTVIRVGDSGAQAAWHDRLSSSGQHR
jgi:hypothetical protein